MKTKSLKKQSKHIEAIHPFLENGYVVENAIISSEVLI
jgi:hypothetical protein